MNKKLDYKFVIRILSELTSFIDTSEAQIARLFSNYNSSIVKENNNYNIEVNRISNLYQSQNINIKKQMKKILDEAQHIYHEICKLEEGLQVNDKYYVKNKKKNEADLVGTYAPQYNDVDDYLKSLEEIKEYYKNITLKYTNRKNRGLTDGLNYLFSSKRKEDYKEIMVLKNTVKKLIDEINKEVPELVRISQDDYDEQYSTNVVGVESRHRANVEQIMSQHVMNIETLADLICENLDNIISDDLIGVLKKESDYYESKYANIDVSKDTFDSSFILGYLEYPYSEFIQSDMIRQLIESKFKPLIVDSIIRIPMLCGWNNESNFFIEVNESNRTYIEKFTHSVMLGFLSFSPIGKIKYVVIDVENRGNSIIPFLEFKKKMPDMFYEKVFTNRDEIKDRLYKLNLYIDDIIQNKLGNRYANIIEYNNDNPDDSVPINLLVIYDFPNGLEEASMAELKNIIKNGARCGVFALICHNKEFDNRGYVDFSQSIIDIKTYCKEIKYQYNSFTTNSLILSMKGITNSSLINALANKYSLLKDGTNKESIVFPPLIRKLLACKAEGEITRAVNDILYLQKNYSEMFGKISKESVEFPKSLVLGNMEYPYEMFSNSFSDIYFKKIEKSFNTGRVIELPFTIEADSNFSLFLEGNETVDINLTNLTHSFILSFISLLPVGKVNVAVFDPEKRGNSFLPFLDFKKRVPEIFDSQVCVSQESIYEKLKKYNDYIDDFIQNKLANGYENIYEYNKASTSSSEKIQLLVVYDFPKCFDNRSYDLLINILKNGSKCGIYCILQYNSDLTVSRYDNHDEYIEQIKKISTNIKYIDGKYLVQPYDLPLKANVMLTRMEMNQFVEDYIKANNDKSNKGLQFEAILASELFSMESTNKLVIPMGIGGGNKVVNMEMGTGSSHHGLIAGATGSGKSTLLHTIIMSSMLNYSPDELNLYLMDFKSGTEFKIYESVKLPHIKLLALDAMQEFGESILENLVAEMYNRGALFKSVGESNISGYKNKTGNKMPRILVVMDEFQILYNDSTNRKVANNCAELTKKLVTEGRAFGIHLIMSTQSTKVIRELTLQQGTIEQMRIRIGLKCGEDDSRFLFTDKNDYQALELMKGPIGTAVLNPEYVDADNIGFRVAYCSKEKQKEYLYTIYKKYENLNVKVQTFEGNRTVNFIEFLQDNKIGMYEKSNTEVYFGEKIKVAPPFVLNVDRRRKHNLLICGSNEYMANNLLKQYILSAALNVNNKIYCIDGDIIVGDNGLLNYYNIFDSNIINIAKNRGQIIEFVKEVYDSYQKCKLTGEPANIFVFIKDLQWIDIIQKMMKDEYIDESNYGVVKPVKASTNPFDFGDLDDDNESESVSSMLRKMIDDGSSVGIYFIVTSNEYAVVKETMYYSDNLLTKFPERIIFSLNDNDADSLIDGVSVLNLNENTVYFSDGVKNLFQFKPFVIERDDEVSIFIKRIKG